MQMGAKNRPAVSHRVPRWGIMGAAVLAAGMSTGCDSLLVVDVPSDVDAAALDNPAMAEVIVQGVIADFECAFANYVFLAGTLADEFMNAGSLQSYNPYDARNVLPSWGSFSSSGCAALGGLYTPLATARFVADDAFRRLSEWTDQEVPNRSRLLATSAAYAGYSLVLFGEGFCETAIDLGPALPPAEVFREAEGRFTSAIEHAEASGTPDLAHLAYLGRARTRLNLGDMTGAAADARRIPDGFRFDATYSGVNPRRENEIHVRTARGRNASIAPDFWDLEWEGVPDPRVEVFEDPRGGLDQLTPLWIPAKYPSESTPIPIATWEEAQLIIAEAEGGAVARDIVNDLHARVGLPPLTTTDPQEVRDHIIKEERRRQLFLQSHRLGDLIRYDLPFPTGLHPWKGVEYGSQTCFPLPDVERFNNPNVPAS